MKYFRLSGWIAYELIVHFCNVRVWYICMTVIVIDAIKVQQSERRTQLKGTWDASDKP